MTITVIIHTDTLSDPAQYGPNPGPYQAPPTGTYHVYWAECAELPGWTPAANSEAELRALMDEYIGSVGLDVGDVVFEVASGQTDVAGTDL